MARYPSSTHVPGRAIWQMAVGGGRHDGSEQGADPARSGAAPPDQRAGRGRGSTRQDRSDTRIDSDDRAYNGDAATRTRSRKGAALVGSIRRRRAPASEVARGGASRDRVSRSSDVLASEPNPLTPLP